MVNDYIRRYRPQADADAEFIKAQPSLRDAVGIAANCVLPNGKRHPHQYRIPHASLAEARSRLLALDLAKCRSFEELHDEAEEAIGDIHMIGPLVLYDVSQRIGAHLGLKPNLVYLHSGTRDGARALGLGRGRKTLEISELPRELHRLSAAEAEDFLCIYKAELARLARI